MPAAKKPSAYRHRDCGGILVPSIFDEIKTSNPGQYRHGCTKCALTHWMVRAHEAWYTPKFAEPM